MYYKIPDAGLGRKPFDSFILKGEAFVVICFWEPRVKKICYFIDIDVYLNTKAKALKKSMREVQIKEIAKHVVDLNDYPSQDLTLQATLNGIGSEVKSVEYEAL